MLRFTPTCVGTMMGPPPGPPGMPVHPHVRGDDAGVNGAALTLAGSPPRAWGRWHVAECLMDKRRFTPTCVGTISTPFPSGEGGSVHPHVRGDDARPLLFVALTGGSPPRAWGRFSRLRLCHPRLRFTPTCVGTITLF